MSNLNKFKNSNQVFKKKSMILLHEKKVISRTHNECLNNFFWPKIFTTNTFMCIKCMNVTRTKCLIAM